MKIEELINPLDAPALYFMQQTAALRQKNDALAIALNRALDLLTNPDAEPEDADTVTEIIRETLKANT